MNTAVVYILLMLAANNHITVKEFKPDSFTKMGVHAAYQRCMQAIPGKVSQPNPDMYLMVVLGFNNRVIVREYDKLQKDDCTNDRTAVYDESSQRNRWVYATCAPKSSMSTDLVIAQCVSKPADGEFHFQ